MKYRLAMHCKLASLLLAPLFLTPAAVHAEFVLNFQPQLTRLGDPEWLNFNCNRPRTPGSGFEGCDENDEFRDKNGLDTTAFLMERVRDSVTGEQYYHTIIGLPGDSFVQETYIKIVRFNPKDGVFSSIPQEDVDDAGAISDSLGNWTDITEKPALGTVNVNNAYDPLGKASFSGSGTANPKSTQFRQVIDSNGVYQEITKASFNKKHRIVQNIDNSGLVGKFDLDMTNSTFDQANIAGIMNKNEQSITSGGKLISTFDINNIPTNGNSNVNISGGKYKYVQKYTTSMTGSNFQNEYEGAGAGYNIWLEDWKAWRVPSQNVGHLYGPQKNN